jgi:arabinan endo-1,5-alpha-L-arabinosidase
VKKRLSVLALALLLLTPVPAHALPIRPAAVEPLLVLQKDFPDPDVSQFGDTYYAYATAGVAPGIRAPYATAPAPTGPWTVQGDALPKRAEWMTGAGIWAPDVSLRDDGKYLMYFTGQRASDGLWCIGAALADGPAGPFTPIGDEPLVCNPDEGGDIDPATFVDVDGQHYLLYKSNGPGVRIPSIIWLQAVEPDGVTFVGPRFDILRSAVPEVDNEHGVIEAPVLIHRDGRYLLFYSSNPYKSRNYQNSYATAPSIFGPYAKSGVPLISRESLAGAIDGPGGADVTSSVEGQHIFFHGWVGRRGVRSMYVVRLVWRDGEPTIAAP